MATKIGRMVTYLERFAILARSHDKLKSYIHYDNIYGYQALQGGDTQ